MLLSVYRVVNTLDGGLGSLRDAIEQVDNGTFDTIDFNIPGSGPFIITPTNGPLPSINKPVFIDGTSQPGFDPKNPAPIIQIDGQNNPTDAGLDLAIGSAGSTIKGLDIYGFSGIGGSGIHVESDDDAIEGNYVGTDVTGTIAEPNATGIWVFRFLPSTIEGYSGQTAAHVTGTTIGGTVTADRNLVSGNQLGIDVENAIPPETVTGNNLIVGNFIGTDVTGKNALPNTSDGVRDVGSNDTIGGTVAGRAERHRIQRRRRGEHLIRRGHLAAKLDLRQQ